MAKRYSKPVRVSLKSCVQLTEYTGFRDVLEAANRCDIGRYASEDQGILFVGELTWIYAPDNAEASTRVAFLGHSIESLSEALWGRESTLVDLGRFEFGSLEAFFTLTSLIVNTLK